MTKDQANYYSGITSITVNGNNAYELKGKFLDDLHKNAFSGTNREDATEHIKYFLKIVDPIDLPNVKQDKLRVVVFPISLVGDAWRWFDGIKGSITSWVDLTAKFFRKYYLPSRTGSDEYETSDLEETNHNDEQKIDEIFRIETNLFDYETPLCKKFKEFNYLLKIYLDVLTKDIEGFKTYEEYKDDWIYEWNKNVPWDSELKEEALRNKAIMEGLINEDVESNNEGWKSWDDFEVNNDDRNEWEYANEHKDDEKYELCGNETHEFPVFTIRRFVMIKYSFGQDEEYVVVKEDEYEDLTNTSEDACRAYQDIFA
ncbi:hypothetical protein Tco_0853621 [Tanacetum coccineum]